MSKRRKRPDYVPVLENTTIKEIAKKLEKTPGQVVLRYLLQRNLVVIPKSVTPSRIQSNYEVIINVFFDRKIKQCLISFRLKY